MILYDFAKKSEIHTESMPADYNTSSELFIMCNNREIPALREFFGWDESTVLDCADIDESVQYSSFDGYDFISLIHMEVSEEGITGGLTLREINLYVSPCYVALALPEHDSPALKQLETDLIKAARNFMEKAGRLNRMYYLIFDIVLSNSSILLEKLEDQLEYVSEGVMQKAYDNGLPQIEKLRRVTYTAKKQLRALSYLGSQILMDENKLLEKKLRHYFRSIDTRMKRLYDFSESVYELCNEILYSYDSKLTLKMNDTVNKLTIITLFCAPLTVITGVYGMNFDFMPELDWKFGYPLAIGVMIAVSICMYWILKKNKWI
ncbi:MAG: magnesium transporter CorA family protein [Clostridiales bacterium]|nr:magnesium transporter CorA family protein [Clostridiales bacterium]